jgi:hypothetical protein
MANDVYQNLTLVIRNGEAHYGDTFVNCRLVAPDGVEAKFLNCVFIGCEFDPPLSENRRGAPWLDTMWGAVIQ